MNGREFDTSVNENKISENRRFLYKWQLIEMLEVYDAKKSIWRKMVDPDPIRCLREFLRLPRITELCDTAIITQEDFYNFLEGSQQFLKFALAMEHNSVMLSNQIFFRWYNGHLQQLPTEVWEKIFSYFTQDELPPIKLTCHHFFQTANMPKVKRNKWSVRDYTLPPEQKSLVFKPLNNLNSSDYVLKMLDEKLVAITVGFESGWVTKDKVIIFDVLSRDIYKILPFEGPYSLWAHQIGVCPNGSLIAPWKEYEILYWDREKNKTFNFNSKLASHEGYFEKVKQLQNGDIIGWTTKYYLGDHNLIVWRTFPFEFKCSINLPNNFYPDDIYERNTKTLVAYSKKFPHLHVTIDLVNQKAKKYRMNQQEKLRFTAQQNNNICVSYQDQIININDLEGNVLNQINVGSNKIITGCFILPSGKIIYSFDYYQMGVPCVRQPSNIDILDFPTLAPSKNLEEKNQEESELEDRKLRLNRGGC